MGDLSTSIGSKAGFDPTEALLERLQERDEQAFAEAFELYKDMVFALSCKLLADRGEAMDVTQEVFLSLFRKIHTFRGECSLKTWLYRVTLNQAANRNRWWKRRRRDLMLSLSLEPESPGEAGPPSPVSDHPLPDRHLFSREIEEAVHRGLGQLPFEQRAVVVLRDVQGLSYEEIAGVTGTNEGTVKSRIARGRERLRQILTEYRPGGSQ